LEKLLLLVSEIGLIIFRIELDRGLGMAGRSSKALGGRGARGLRRVMVRVRV
jgi:hypothetical protein